MKKLDIASNRLVFVNCSGNLKLTHAKGYLNSLGTSITHMFAALTLIIATLVNNELVLYLINACPSKSRDLTESV